MDAIAENLWVLKYPLRVLGADIGRTVSVIRLQGGELIIHSSAPFSARDVAEIRALGTPGWLVDAVLFHDTYAREGYAAFPELLYLAPEGFAKVAGVPSQSLEIPPAAWAGQVDVLRIEGMSRAEDHVFLHRASRTLIVTDLLFNLGRDASAWTRVLLALASGLRTFPGFSRIYRRMICNRTEFMASMARVLAWDFDRIIVAHGEVVASDGKRKLAAALQAAGLVESDH